MSDYMEVIRNVEGLKSVGNTENRVARVLHLLVTEHKGYT